MDLTLKRNQWLSTGIFGTLFDLNSNQIAVTLEHAYLQPNGLFEPKIPVGAYTCRRGMHQLFGMEYPFETFEITNVPGHLNILFHPGNYNQDSSGCVLLGQQATNNMITNSRNTFERFMDREEGEDVFILRVI